MEGRIFPFSILFYTVIYIRKKKRRPGFKGSTLSSIEKCNKY